MAAPTRRSQRRDDEAGSEEARAAATRRRIDCSAEPRPISPAPDPRPRGVAFREADGWERSRGAGRP